MVRYRRNRIAGATYFFTVTLRNRRSDLLVREIDALRDAWRQAVLRLPHAVIASVVLPDHLHAVIRMEDSGADFPRLWQDIKKGFVFRVAKRGPSPWQPRFWEHTIRDDADLRAHVDYVHINPVKHGLVTCLVQWPHSSFHRYVREGRLPRHGGATMGMGDVKSVPGCAALTRATRLCGYARNGSRQSGVLVAHPKTKDPGRCRPGSWYR